MTQILKQDEVIHDRQYRQQQFVIGIVAIGLLVYTIARAYLVDITPDEIISWEDYASKLVFYPKTYWLMSANNHWLNSCLMHYSAAIFGESPFAFRLPNLLAHCAYLFFTARIVLLRKRNLVLNLSFFLLLNVHPYMLDFFSLARGYGLALGAMSAGLFYAYRFVEGERSNKNLILIAVSGIICVLSNFLLLDFLAGILFILSISIVVEKTGWIQKTKQLALLFIPVLLLLLFVLPHLHQLNEAKALYYGSETLWDGSVKTLLTQLMYEAPYSGNATLNILKAVIIFMIAIVVYTSHRDLRLFGFLQWMKSLPGFFTLVFCLIVAALIAQHLITHALYPLNRTGLFVFVSLLLAFLFSLETIPFKMPVAMLTSLFALLLVAHFFFRANFTYALEWKGSGGVEKFLTTIVNQRKELKNPPAIVNISTAGESGFTLGYLLKREKINWLKGNLTWENALPAGDYYLVQVKENFHQNTTGWVKIDSCIQNGNVLYVDTAFIHHYGK